MAVKVRPDIAQDGITFMIFGASKLETRTLPRHGASFTEHCRK